MASPEEYQHYKRTLCSINFGLLRTPLCTQEIRRRKSTPSKNGTLIIHLCCEAFLPVDQVFPEAVPLPRMVGYKLTSHGKAPPERMNECDGKHTQDFFVYLHLCWSKRSPPVAEVDSGSSFCREECYESDVRKKQPSDLIQRAKTYFSLCKKCCALTSSSKGICTRI